MFFTPLLDRLIAAGKIAGIGLQPSLLAVLLPSLLTRPVLAYLLPVSSAFVRVEISATVDTSLSLLSCIVHPLSYENYPAGREEVCGWFKLLRHYKNNKSDGNRQVILPGALPVIAYSSVYHG